MKSNITDAGGKLKAGAARVTESIRGKAIGKKPATAREAGEKQGVFADFGSALFTELGLTAEQTEILYNMQKQKTCCDIEQEQNPDKKALKSKWVGLWETAISDAYTGISGGQHLRWFDEGELIQSTKEALAASPNKMWFHLAILETTLFVLYHPLKTETKGEGKKKKEVASKEFSAAKPAKSTKECEWAKNFMAQCGHDPAFVERIRATHKKVVNRLSERNKKIVIMTLVDLAAILATALTAGLLAPALAPSIAAAMGAQFAFSGAALTSASLAFIAGGSLAAGGGGMIGGTLIIAGGGGLLGLLGSAAVNGGAASLGLLSNKAYAISQNAKLEVTLREIILNTQHDVRFAQLVMERFKEQIISLNGRITEMELDAKTDKKLLKDLKAVVDIMKKSVKQSGRFISSFELGLAFEEEAGEETEDAEDE